MQTMHEWIISDILTWDETQRVYLPRGEGQLGKRYDQRLKAADLMAEIQARWEHRPGGFHAERKRIKTSTFKAVADSAPLMSSEDPCAGWPSQPHLPGKARPSAKKPEV